MLRPNISDEFKQKIELLHGKAGTDWLNLLPWLIEKYENEWNIKVLDPFTLSYNYVCPAVTSQKRSAVIKICFPRNKEFVTELETLHLFPQAVSIQILKEDRQNGVILLEQAIPGKPIKEISSDQQQIHLVSQVIKKLHRSIPLDSTSLFPTISDWAKAFDRYKSQFSISSGPIPTQLFNQGSGIFSEFLQDNKEQVLLHGDLHNDNILSSQRGWIVIDPKGVIGEREFELGAFLRNPYYDIPKDNDHKTVEAHRIAQFAEELGFDRERVRLWALACSTISMIWFLEDEKSLPEIYVRNAELINQIKV